MCGKGFPSEEILEVHFDKHDLPELPEDLEEQCSICHRIFDTDSLLQIHIEKEHRPKREEDIHVDEWVSKLIMSPLHSERLGEICCFTDVDVVKLSIFS